MAISIKEAMNTNEKTISYKLPSGREEFATVKIPAGIQHGVTFKYKGMGDDSIKSITTWRFNGANECFRF